MGQGSPVAKLADETAMTGRNPLEGTGDCSRCAALCCMALAFDRAQGFGIDKPNAEPCPNLTGGDRCAIHAHREQSGFPGCVTFDCGGAGQYVSETVFGGRHWRDDERLRHAMTGAFSTVRDIAALDELLAAVDALPLSASDAAERQRLAASLWPADGWTPAALRRFEADGIASDIRRFLRTLRRYTAPGDAAGPSRRR